MPWFLAIAAIVLLALAFARSYNTRRKILRYTRGFRCPKSRHWLFGHLAQFSRDPVGITMRTLEIKQQYGPDTVLWRLGNDHHLIVGSAVNAAKVPMAKDTAKADLYRFLEPWLGLLLSAGKKWFQRRKIIVPTFHFKTLESFVGIITGEADALVNNLCKLEGKEEFDEPISLFAMNNICANAMGVHMNALVDPSSQYVSDVKRMAELVLKRIYHPLNLYPKLFWAFTPNAWEQRKLIERLRQFTDSVIKKRREEIKPIKGQEADNKKPATFLDVLLQVTIDRKPLTDADIREEVDTFMLRGYDSSASGICFTIYQLAKHQDIFPLSCDIKNRNATFSLTIPHLLIISKVIL